MRIVVLEEIPEDPDLRSAWNELALTAERPEVFYTYDWAVAVQRAYANFLKPMVLLAYDGDELMGLVALARDKTEMRQVTCLTGNTADYCDFLSRTDRRREFVQAVLSELKNRKVEKIVLTNLPADSCTTAAIYAAASSARYYLHMRSAYLCARVILRSTEQRAAVKQGISAKKRLRRNMRALEKQGPVCVRHDTRWDQIEPILQGFNRAHVARFLSAGKISNLMRSERRIFLSELACALSRSGWVAVSRLLVGDISVAWNYGFRYAGSWFWYQPTVNGSRSYIDLSPGYCLLSKIIELSCDLPEIEVVDLGLGAEDYKERFATANRETLYCVMHTSFSSHLRTVVRDRAAAVAKASPAMEKWIRVMISYIARARTRARQDGMWGLLRWFFRRIWSYFFAFDEVHFFEWSAEDQDRDTSTSLVPLDSDLLGGAAIQYADDRACIDYLIRSARRFRDEADHGFALLTAERTPVHFCWVKDFEGFEMAELGRTLQSPGKNAVMIFDCFTPGSARGHKFFARAITALALQLRAQRSVPWIFGAASNRASLRGIEKSGFAHRFSLGRKRIFFRNWTRDSIPSARSGNIASSVPAP